MPDPFRADVVGSLLRPEYLKSARAEWEAVFSRLPGYDRFLLEYDSPRAGSLQAIADVPDDKVVVLGLISTKKTELETMDELLGRINEAAGVFPRDQLAVSTQCGFASSSLGKPISMQTERDKLALVAEVARRGWEQ